MKRGTVVDLYKHDDGRLVEIVEESDDSFSLRQIYPTQKFLEESKPLSGLEETLKSMEFAVHKKEFAPPCPCPSRKPCTMRLDTGLYTCTECGETF